MYRAFLERMVGYELIVIAKIKKFGRTFHNPPQVTFFLENPVTKNGIKIDDHIWIAEKDFSKMAPLLQGQTITFSCTPYCYRGRMNEVGYGLGKIKVLEIKNESVQVYA